MDRFFLHRVGDNGCILTSPDTKKWELRNPAFTTAIRLQTKPEILTVLYGAITGL
jgi:hypothetical protein